jgi:hypothetical protein
MAVLEGNENEIHVHEAVDSEMHVSDFQVESDRIHVRMEGKGWVK